MAATLLARQLEAQQGRQPTQPLAALLQQPSPAAQQREDTPASPAKPEATATMPVKIDAEQSGEVMWQPDEEEQHEPQPEVHSRSRSQASETPEADMQDQGNRPEQEEPDQQSTVVQLQPPLDMDKQHAQTHGSPARSHKQAAQTHGSPARSHKQAAQTHGSPARSPAAAVNPVEGSAANADFLRMPFAFSSAALQGGSQQQEQPNTHQAQIVGSISKDLMLASDNLSAGITAEPHSTYHRSNHAVVNADPELPHHQHEVAGPSLAEAPYAGRSTLWQTSTGVRHQSAAGTSHSALQQSRHTSRNSRQSKVGHPLSLSEPETLALRPQVEQRVLHAPAQPLLEYAPRTSFQQNGGASLSEHAAAYAEQPGWPVHLRQHQQQSLLPLKHQSALYNDVDRRSGKHEATVVSKMRQGPGKHYHVL